MAKINPRDFYLFYHSDFFIEIPDEVLSMIYWSKAIFIVWDKTLFYPFLYQN